MGNSRLISFHIQNYSITLQLWVKESILGPDIEKNNKMKPIKLQ